METNIKNTKELIDLLTWKRKDHYQHFSRLAQPYWGITVQINCTQAYTYCKANGISFSLYYLYQSLKAANSVTELKYRIIEKEVYVFKKLNGSIPVLRNDATFGFAYFDYHPQFQLFSAQAKKAIQHIKTGCGLEIRPKMQDLIHFSVLPGIAFTGMQHAQDIPGEDSIPKIAFGKLSGFGGQLLMPVSLHVNHALCDGVHAEYFFNRFSKAMELT